MKTYAVRSLALFGFSLFALIVFTLVESSFTELKTSMQRGLTFVTLVVPAAIGCAFGVMSLLRKEGRVGLALAGAVLNGLFAAFQLLIVLFAG